MIYEKITVGCNLSFITIIRRQSQCLGPIIPYRLLNTVPLYSHWSYKASKFWRIYCYAHYIFDIVIYYDLNCILREILSILFSFRLNLE